jgi:hypothetical protein
VFKVDKSSFIYFLLTSSPCGLYNTAGSRSELFHILVLYPQLKPGPLAVIAHIRKISPALIIPDKGQS